MNGAAGRQAGATDEERHTGIEFVWAQGKRSCGQTGSEGGRMRGLWLVGAYRSGTCRSPVADGRDGTHWVPPPPKASANSQSQHEHNHKHNHARGSIRRISTRTDRKSRRCRWSRSASPPRAWRPPHPRDHPPGRQRQQRQKAQLRIACAEGDRGRRTRSGSLVLKVT